MRWKRENLIKRIREEITRREVAAELANAERHEKAVADRKAYTDRTNPAWLDFAANIGAAVAAGRPVTVEDCPQALRDPYETRVALHRADHWTPPMRDADTAELHTLIDLLDVATDDEISLTSLERAGIKISRAFRRTA